MIRQVLFVGGALGAMGLAMAAGCSGGPKAGAEGGPCLPNGTCNTGLTCVNNRCQASDEGGTKLDGSTDAKKDTSTTDSQTGMCPLPADVSNYMPQPLPAPTGKHQNKCSQALLDTYHKCVLQKDMASCTTITQNAMMEPWKTCLQCLEGAKETDTMWGPLYCGVNGDPMLCRLNIEGCLNLAIGQSGPTSCGQLLHDSYGCQLMACDYCGSDQQGFTKCVQNALNGGCKKYGDAFTNKCGNITDDPDGGYPDIRNCFRLQGEMDSTGLRTRIDTFFCGP